MKILVIHTTGNTGKSFLTREVFYQNMEVEEKMLIELESHNSSSSKFPDLNSKKISLDRDDALSEINHLSIILENFVMDAGSSQAPYLMNILNLTPEFLDPFDVIIVPTMKNGKIIEDTIKTLAILKTLDALEKTRVVFNKVHSSSTIEEDFKKFFAWGKREGIKMNPDLFLREFKDAEEDLSSLKILSGDLLRDETDYEALSVQAHKDGDEKKSKEWSDRLLTQRISKSLNKAGKELYEKILTSLK